MPKIYAACGAVGFVLSFVVGIFSGASFLLVLIKALIFGAIFAGLAVLLSFLQKRFMPDLFDTNDVAAPIPKARASKLDITISDDGDAHPEEDASSVPDFMKNRIKGKSGEVSASGAERRDEPNVASPASESAQSTPAPVDDARAAEDSPNADAAPSGNESMPPADELSADMPDAASFASINDEENENENAPLAPPPLEGGYAKNEPPSSDVDVATMAKAIRTVLAKEK